MKPSFSSPILSLNKDSYLILPKTVSFQELTSEISYDVSGENEVAAINYYYEDTYVGTASVDLAKATAYSSYDFDSAPITPAKTEPVTSGMDNTIFSVCGVPWLPLSYPGFSDILLQI